MWLFDRICWDSPHSSAASPSKPIYQTLLSSLHPTQLGTLGGPGNETSIIVTLGNKQVGSEYAIVWSLMRDGRVCLDGVFVCLVRVWICLVGGPRASGCSCVGQRCSSRTDVFMNLCVLICLFSSQCSHDCVKCVVLAYLCSLSDCGT